MMRYRFKLALSMLLLWILAVPTGGIASRVAEETRSSNPKLGKTFEEQSDPEKFHLSLRSPHQIV